MTSPAASSPPLLPVRACASGRSARALGRGPHALQTCPGTAVPAIITFPRLEEGRKCLLKGRRILSRVDVTSLSVISSWNQLSQRRSALWHPNAVCSVWHLRENALRRARKSAVSAGVTNPRSDPGSVPPQLRNHGSRVPRHRRASVSPEAVPEPSDSWEGRGSLGALGAHLFPYLFLPLSLFLSLPSSPSPAFPISSARAEMYFRSRPAGSSLYFLGTGTKRK